jgi:hypothetical protein
VPPASGGKEVRPFPSCPDLFYPPLVVSLLLPFARRRQTDLRAPSRVPARTCPPFRMVPEPLRSHTRSRRRFVPLQQAPLTPTPTPTPPLLRPSSACPALQLQCRPRLAPSPLSPSLSLSLFLLLPPPTPTPLSPPLSLLRSLLLSLSFSLSVPLRQDPPPPSAAPPHLAPPVRQCSGTAARGFRPPTRARPS